MTLIPVAEAQARILATLAPLPGEEVALGAALGRVSAQPIAARLDQPPFASSAMDGYAVRAGDVAQVPVELEVIGEAPAGHAFAGSVGPGQAVRIFTGAPLPDGADTVIIQENCTPAGNARVRVVEAPGGNRYVRERGLDFRHGEQLIAAGRRLGPRDIALAAAMNQARILVRRRPRVAILATGDELVAPGNVPRPDQIISSNSFGIAAFVEQFGGAPIDLGIAADTVDSLQQAAARVGDADILVTLGGASVGDHDLVQGALGAVGLEIDFWKIAMRPGKPLMFGRLGASKVLGLPGNPVSTLVCARLFLKIMLDRLLGLDPSGSEMLSARLASALPANDRRQDYLRATLARGDDGQLMATPFARQDSSMLRTMAHADGLIVRAPHAEPAPAGAMVDVLPLDF